MQCVNNFQLEIIVWKNQVSKTNFPAKMLGWKGRQGRDSEKKKKKKTILLHANVCIALKYQLCKKNFAVQLRIITEDPQYT